MSNLARIISIIVGVILLIFAAGYITQQPWATATWPFQTGPLSYTFVGAICAAMAIAVLWVALSGEWGAVAAGALNLFVMAAGAAIFLFQMYASGSAPNALPFTIVSAVFALFNAGLFIWARRIPIQDTRPLPHFVRIAFVIFIAALVVVGGALLIKMPNIMPWPVTPEVSVLIGWVFIGDAFYFMYALTTGKWHGGRAQLLSFLAYDALLIIPLLRHLSNVQPGSQVNLIVYLIIVLFSAVVAIYFLFINPGTRRWNIQRA